jgi:hypothetical protein
LQLFPGETDKQTTSGTYVVLFLGCGSEVNSDIAPKLDYYAAHVESGGIGKLIGYKIVEMRVCAWVG